MVPPGLPDDLIQKGKDLKGVSEVVQNGKHFKLTITTGSKVIQNEFTLGEECELESMTGEKIKVGAAPAATSAPGPSCPSLVVPSAGTPCGEGSGQPLGKPTPYPGEHLGCSGPQAQLSHVGKPAQGRILRLKFSQPNALALKGLGEGPSRRQ